MNIEEKTYYMNYIKNRSKELSAVMDEMRRLYARVNHITSGMSLAASNLEAEIETEESVNNKIHDLTGK
jgi:hypothetical protein